MPDSTIIDLLPVIFNVLILLFFSAVFSGAETAYTSLSPARMEVIKNDGKFASSLTYNLYKKLDLIITSNLILSNAVNIFLATYLTLFFTEMFGVSLGGVLSASIGTILVIIFGEIIPKKIAILVPIQFAKLTAHLLHFLNIVFVPIIFPLQMLNRLLDKINKKVRKQDVNEEREFLEEEIKAALGIGHMQGVLENKEYQMMQKLLLLNDKEAKDIMAPRSDIVAINSKKTLRDLVVMASEHSFSRIPVYTDSIENIEYIIHIPQLSAHLMDPKNLDRPILDFCSAKAFVIPESKILDDLFFEFQKKRVHLAIVLNEFGETSGLITLEDIVEQIFGEIEDETDKVEIEIEEIEKNIFKVEGDVSLEKIEEVTKIEFSQEYPKNKSIGWLVLDILHRFPNEGEVLTVPDSNIQLKIIDKDDEYIDQIHIIIGSDAN